MSQPNPAEDDDRSPSQKADSVVEPSDSAVEDTLCWNRDSAVESSSGVTAGRPSNRWIGKTLGRFQITGLLGKGGMGLVLKGRDPVIERDVAIKVLPEEFANEPTALTRFLSEAKSVGKLNHPHVVGILEVDSQEGVYFLAMEYMSGGSLSDRLEKLNALSVLEATQAMIDACRGISAAHAAGMIHRDIKPANFLRSAEGVVKVADFGLAKGFAAQSRQITQAGSVIGTPFFMSPEQCQQLPVDERSDIYSLGASYYSLLTGKNPYQDSTNVPQVMYAHCHADVPDPRKEDHSIPAACSKIIARAMAKDPAERYQTVGEMLDDLELIAATLSGKTLSALPSESGRHVPVLAADSLPASSTMGRSGLLRLAVIGGGVIALLMALLMMAYRFDKPKTDLPGGAALLSAEPIKIGVLHSLSGTNAASESSVVDAVKFAIDEINQAGGVLGRPLKLVIADGESDSDIFAGEARRLIDQEEVAVIFGCWTSSSRKAVKSIVEEANHLLIYPLRYEGLESSTNIVYLGATPNQQILPGVRWAFDSLGKRKFYLTGTNSVFSRVASEIIKDELESLGGVVVGEDYLTPGKTDVDFLVENIRHAQPDMVLNTVQGDSNTALFRALRRAEIRSEDIPTLSFSIDVAGLRNLRPEVIAGDYTAWSYYETLDSEENLSFVKRFQEKYPRKIVTDPMESTYSGVILWAAAANQAQSLQSRPVRYAMRDQRLSSPSGLLRLDPDTQHSWKIPRIGQIQANGRTKVVWEAANPIAPDPFPDSRTSTQWLGLLDDLYREWGKRWSGR